MRKIISISFLLIAFLSDAAAQKKIIYQDTSLLQQDEPVEDVQIVESPVESQVDVVAQSYDEEYTDTVLYRNNLYLPYDSVQNWKNLKEYAYTKYLDSLLKNRKKKELKPASQPRGEGILNGILNSGLVRIFFWTVVILFVLFIIYRLFLADGAFKRKSKSAKNTEAEVEEEVITRQSDFDALIRIALQNGNYRQAVRYQYLRTLHSLANKNFVELAPDKTNFQYVHEIKNRNHQQDFAALTLHYEYVWYGEFNIEKNIYQKIENNFISLNQKL